MTDLLCLFVFWAGVFCLFRKNPWSLKERAETGFGKRVMKGSEIKGVLGALKALFLKEPLMREISEVLGYVRNIAILGRSSDISAQLLLEELSDISGILKPVFGEMSRYMSVSDKKSAAGCFAKNTGLKISKGMGEFLAGWDDVKPSEILETVDAYQSLLSGERLTAAKRKSEIISDLVYFPVVINCMLILLDFVYVSFFVEQQEALTLL